MLSDRTGGEHPQGLVPDDKPHKVRPRRLDYSNKIPWMIFLTCWDRPGPMPWRNPAGKQTSTFYVAVVELVK